MESNKEDSSLFQRLTLILERSTVHGIPSIVTTKRFGIRILWGIFISLACGVCLYMLGTNTNAYFKYEVDTVIDNVEDNQDNPTDFPTVTLCTVEVCNLQPSYNSFYQNISSFLPYSNIAGNDTPINQSSKSLNDLAKQAYIDLLKANQVDLDQVLNGTDLRKMLLSCQYNGENCNENDFVRFKLNDFQYCFRFNGRTKMNGEPATIKKTQRYGKEYGLQLQLYVGMRNNCESPFNIAEGMVMFIHNNTYNITSDSTGIDLAIGVETNIAIDRTLITQKPPPYTECINSKEKPENSNDCIEDTFKNFRFYSREVCLQICYQKFLNKNYNCSDPYLIMLDKPPCPRIIDGINNSIFYDMSAYFDNPETDKNCNEQCREECEYATYSMTVSNLLFPTDRYAEILVRKGAIPDYYIKTSGDDEFDGPNSVDDLKYQNNEPFLCDKVKSSVLAVNAYYRSNSYTLIRQKAQVEQDTYISNVGGALSLCLGISLLSFIELIELLVEVICVKFFTDKNKKNKVFVIKEKLVT